MRGEDLVRDVKQRVPETAAVFEKFSVRTNFFNLPTEEATRRARAPLAQVQADLDEIIYLNREITA